MRVAASANTPKTCASRTQPYGAFGKTYSRIVSSPMRTAQINLSTSGQFWIASLPAMRLASEPPECSPNFNIRRLTSLIVLGFQVARNGGGVVGANHGTTSRVFLVLTSVNGADKLNVSRFA